MTITAQHLGTDESIGIHTATRRGGIIVLAVSRLREVLYDLWDESDTDVGTGLGVMTLFVF